MANSVTITSDTRAKVNNTPKQDVWEVVITLFTDNGGHAEGIIAIPLNGIVRSMVVSAPATTSTGTSSTVTIDDNSNAEVFNTGALAESATPYVFAIDLPLSGTIDLSLDMDGDPGAGGVSNVVTLRGI
jgi:hypothetical protein